MAKNRVALNNRRKKKVEERNKNIDIERTTQGDQKNLKEQVKELNYKVELLEQEIIGDYLEKDDQFEADLQEIDGIGKNIAQDIINLYPTEQTLKNAIDTGEHLPFRDDIVNKLKKRYGK